MALLFLGQSARAREVPDQPPGVEVQARGPVHEAFAQPVNTSPEQGIVVTKPPPALIDEVPPDQKPEGDNVEWIPGYWSWEDEKSDYIWVSGFWRIPPPGMRWMPGHWQEIDKGWLWVVGFWAPVDVQEVRYLPAPPPAIEQGPSTPAPDANSVYVAGCWVYREARYYWRPGYWTGYKANWVWIPSRYIWTPSGCLFNEGYWDHPLDERGLLFAPVRFDQRVWAEARRPYIPQFVVSSDFLIGALFVGPSRRYYFGDFFEERYEKRGFVAWSDYHPSAGAFDSNFSYYRHLHAAEPRWEPALRELYRGRRSGDVPRPPQTLVQQATAIKNITVNKTTNVVVRNNINLTHVQNVTALAPLKEVHNIHVTNLGALSQAKETKVPARALKVETVTKDEHAREVKAAVQVRAVAQQRHDTEARMHSQGGNPILHTDAPKAVKLELPKPVPAITPRPAVKVAPPPPMIPKHEERPIPKYTPNQPPPPPKKP
jgi:hypothetical protein